MTDSEKLNILVNGSIDDIIDLHTSSVCKHRKCESECCEFFESRDCVLEWYCTTRRKLEASKESSQQSFTSLPDF